jgi:hypothetical protein
VLQYCAGQLMRALDAAAKRLSRPCPHVDVDMRLALTLRRSLELQTELQETPARRMVAMGTGGGSHRTWDVLNACNTAIPVGTTEGRPGNPRPAGAC